MIPDKRDNPRPLTHPSLSGIAWEGRQRMRDALPR